MFFGIVVPKRLVYPFCSSAGGAPADDEEDVAAAAVDVFGVGTSCCRLCRRTLMLKSSCLISQSSFQKAHNAHLRKMD